jgi:hypothetical protein
MLPTIKTTYFYPTNWSWLEMGEELIPKAVSSLILNNDERSFFLKHLRVTAFFSSMILSSF